MDFTDCQSYSSDMMHAIEDLIARQTHGQQVVAASSTQVEYIDACDACQNDLSLHYSLGQPIELFQRKPINICVDNQGAKCIATSKIYCILMDYEFAVQAHQLEVSRDAGLCYKKDFEDVVCMHWKQCCKHIDQTSGQCETRTVNHNAASRS